MLALNQARPTRSPCCCCCCSVLLVCKLIHLGASQQIGSCNNNNNKTTSIILIAISALCNATHLYIYLQVNSVYVETSFYCYYIVVIFPKKNKQSYYHG